MGASDQAMILARASAARAGRQNDISVLLACFILCLGVLMLLFASPTFARAMALVGSC